MPTLNPTVLPLTKDSLYQLVALNPVAIGRSAVMNAFGSGDDIRHQVDLMLATLVAEGKIKSDNDRNYRATEPWADIAYAVVGPVAYDRRLSIPIKLLNIPDDLNIHVTMSRDELNKRHLKEGDKIVVGLVRNNNNHTDLRARYLAHVEDGKPFHLTGTFNHKAHAFAPLDRSIKADLKFMKEPEPTDVPRQFLVELPAHFDIRNPVIHVAEDQTRNMTTGAAISWIITSKHQIAHAHPEKCAARSPSHQSPQA